VTVQWDVGYITRKRADMHPEKTAIIFEDQPITYKELNDGVNRCAHLFRRKGIRKGDRIAVVLLNCIEFLEAYFAAAKLGAIFVPLNWRLAPPELEYQLNDCGARMLLFHDAFLANVESIRSAIQVEEDKVIFLKSGSPTMPGFELPGCPDWAEEYEGLAKDQPITEPDPEDPVEFDDPLAILYTSGTTGNPKGAILSHAQTYFKNFQIAAFTRGGTDAVMVAQVPLFHSGGLFIVATPCLCAGTTMVMRRGFDPNQFAEDIEKYRATNIFALTTMWRMILETGKLDEIDTSSVQFVGGGGERTPPSLFEELSKRGLHMQQGFGQTECSAMTNVPREDVFRKMGSIGKPGFFVDLWIAREDGTKAGPGEIGEIVAKGPTVMSGYWNLPEKTAEAIKDGVLYTGDLGYVDEEGYFYIVDRAKDMYRSGGENVYPAEVEKILAGHPKISNVAIIGVPDDKWGEAGLAFVVAAQGETITKEEIREFLKDKVAKFKHPKTIEFVEDLPLTATMKIRKAELKKMYVDGR
jgi:fatty-acyl-CoA synthase